MIRQVLTAAVLAGIAGGFLVSAFQSVRVIPLVLEAETFEAAGPATAAGHVGEGAEHREGAWAPAEGLERTVYTVLTNVLTAIGFALVLAACFALERSVDWRRGVLWGLAGFAVFHLAPALGLPPELPGTSAAPLFERQAWWLATVAATAAGLALVVFAPRRAVKALGIVLIVAPHAVGAPEAQAPGGLVPAELAAEFAAASLVTAAAFWVALGGLTGFFFRRLAAGA
ncbi:MAG: CbtA family protein [Alphaproteobacteria bacterium]